MKSRYRYLKRKNLLFAICAVSAAYFANNGGISTAFLSSDAINMIMQFLFLAVTFIYLFLGRHLKAVQRGNIVFCYVVLFLITLPRSGWSLFSIVRYFSILLFSLMCISSIKTICYTIKILTVCYLIYAIFTFIEFFSRNFYISHIYKLFNDTTGVLMNAYKLGYMAGITSHISSNAMFLSCGLLLSATKYLAAKQKKYLFLSTVFLVALLLTGKRGHIVFMAVALYGIYYLSLSGQKASNKLIKTIGIILLVVAIGSIVMYFLPSLTAVFGRIMNFLEGDDTSTQVRFKLWALALNAFKEHPIIGIGWRQFYSSLSYLVGSNREFEVHNVYLQLLCETGIIGFLIYVGWFFYAIKNAIKTYLFIKKEKTEIDDLHMIGFAAAFQIFFMLYSFTGNPLYDWKMNIPYFLSCGITIYYKNKYKKSANQ